MSGSARRSFVPRFFALAAVRSLVISTLVFVFLYLVGLLQGYYWLAALITVLLYGRAVWRYYGDRERLTVTIGQGALSGPGTTRWSKRVEIPLNQIDRRRSARATFVEKVLGYRNVYGREGQVLTLDAWLLGRRQLVEILQTLRVEF